MFWSYFKWYIMLGFNKAAVLAFGLVSVKLWVKSTEVKMNTCKHSVCHSVTAVFKAPAPPPVSDIKHNYDVSNEEPPL